MYKVHVLSNEEIQKRYPIGCTSATANFATKALEQGYQIAQVENENFSKYDGSSLLYYSQIAIETAFPNKTIRIPFFIDLSEYDNNKIIVAFETLGIASAHGINNIRLSDH